MNSASVRGLLLRGMLAGVGAGALALVVAYALGEPQIDAALAHEHAHGEEVVSRSLQSTAGLATGLLVYGAALGGLAALAVAFALGRVGRFGPRATALLVAVGALVTVYAVPFLKYPANPPGVGDPGSVGRRTALFFLMVVLSVLLAVGAVLLGRRLAPRLGNWYAAVVAAGAFTAAVALGVGLLPASTVTVPDHFPADLLWRFRLSSAATHVTLWVSFGLLFGELAERLLLPRAAGRQGQRATAAPAEPTVAR